MNINFTQGTILVCSLALVSEAFSQESGNLFTPEEVKRFADHLFREGDYLRAASEYERFLFVSENGDDSTLFKIGLCHQLLDNHRLAVNVFNRIETDPQVSKLDSLIRIASLYSYSRLERWEEILNVPPMNDEEFYFYYCAEAANNPGRIETSFFDDIKDDSLRNNLRKLDQKRVRLKNKSPKVAGVLSVFLPGAGKMYYGRVGDGLFSMAATYFSGLVSYMAFKEGRDVTGLVTTTMAMSFYLGTIYGSYIGADLHNKRIFQDWKTELNRFNPVEQNPYWERWQ